MMTITVYLTQFSTRELILLANTPSSLRNEIAIALIFSVTILEGTYAAAANVGSSRRRLSRNPSQSHFSRYPL